MPSSIQTGLYNKLIGTSLPCNNLKCLTIDVVVAIKLYLDKLDVNRRGGGTSANCWWPRSQQKINKIDSIVCNI